MNHTVLELKQNELKEQARQILIETIELMKILELHASEPPRWERLGDEKDLLFQYLRTLSLMKITEGMTLMNRFFLDLETSVPFGWKIPISDQNEDAYFRVVVNVAIDDKPFEFKRGSWDMRATVLYYYSGHYDRYGLHMRQKKIHLLHIDVLKILKALIPLNDHTPTMLS